MWKNELRKMIMAAIGHVHPILIEPISFACEGDRSRFVALSWRACDLGERADCDAHRNDFTHVSRRGVWFLHKTHKLFLMRRTAVLWITQRNWPKGTAG
jgi:hypothetical protein